PIDLARPAKPASIGSEPPAGERVSRPFSGLTRPADDPINNERGGGMMGDGDTDPPSVWIWYTMGFDGFQWD
ncbi:MAG: hypothetical protein AAFQ73_13605, partial [Pseudomonadota bacterium]